MLRWRLILGAVFIGSLAALVLLDVWAATESGLPPGLVLVPLLLTIVGAATREYVSLVQTREPEVDGLSLGVLNWLVVAAPWLGACVGGAAAEQRWQLAAFVGAVIFAFVREMWRYDKDKSQRVTERLALAMLGLVYLGLLPSFIVRLRLLPEGIWPLLMMLAVVKMGDIGAYTVGRLVGRRKLVPKLSPGKTWEGLGGGLLFAIAAAIGCWSIPGLNSNVAPVPVGPFIAFGVAICLVGAAGDLAESLLKRDFGRKDSSTWMPGFGGVLDLIDSPLFAAPVAWAFWEFGWL